MSLTIRLDFSPVRQIGRRRKGGFEIALMQAMEEMQTRLHPPNSSTHFSYNRVPWKLKVSFRARRNQFSCLDFSDSKGGFLSLGAVDQPNNRAPRVLPGKLFILILFLDVIYLSFDEIDRSPI